jgi:hypothetical protein
MAGLLRNNLKNMKIKKLREISKVCEFFARIESGDIREIGNHDKYIASNREILEEIQPYFLQNRKSTEGLVCWDIYQIIRHEFWKLNKDKNSFDLASSVHLQIADSKNIKCVIKGDKCSLKLDFWQKQAVNWALKVYKKIGKSDLSILFDIENLRESFEKARRAKRESLPFAVSKIIKAGRRIKKLNNPNKMLGSDY